MKTTLLTTALLGVLTLGTWSHASFADTAEAMCEVRKEGDTKQKASGPCDFSQRQGYVSINLRNGDRHELSPGGKPDHFKDLKGNKVVRKVTGPNTQEYKWEHTRIIVNFPTAAAASAPAHGGMSSDLQDLVGAKAGQAEGELQRRGYEYRSGSTSGDSKYSSWYNRANGRCVMIRTADGRYQSIVDAPMADCERR